MKKISVLLTVLLVISQTFICSFGVEDYVDDFSSDGWSSPHDEWIAERVSYSEPTPEISEEIKSKDGKYGYVLNKDTGEAYFSHSYETHITVLNIPEEIDGHRIVGTIHGFSEWPFLLEVNYSKYIKEIYCGGMCFSVVPCCKINLNEGLEVIHSNAIDKFSSNFEMYGEVHFDEIIFPSTLKEIKPEALDPNIKRIVFQSDPVVDLSYWYQDVRGDSDEINDIYYTGNALNATEKSFCEWYEHVEDYSLVYSGNWKIHHKPGANGFDKLKKAGYDVEEYTEEVWETQSKANNPAQKIVVDDITLKVPVNKNVKIKAKILPENADTPRIWYYAIPAYGVIDLGTDGTIGGYGYVQRAGKSAKAVAVAENGIYTEFTISLTDGNATATKKTQTGSATNEKNENKADIKAPIIIFVVCIAVAVAVIGAIVVIKRKNSRNIKL